LAQGAQLGQGEVVGEPAGGADAVDHLGGLAVGELGVAGHVGGRGDVRLVSRHELVVLGGDQVRLDVVGAQLDGVPVGRQGVLRPVAGGAAVADDDRAVHPGAVTSLAVGGARTAMPGTSSASNRNGSSAGRSRRFT
jgi:hypothetical protein